MPNTVIFFYIFVDILSHNSLNFFFFFFFCLTGLLLSFSDSVKLFFLVFFGGVAYILCMCEFLVLFLWFCILFSCLFSKKMEKKKGCGSGWVKRSG